MTPWRKPYPYIRDIKDELLDNLKTVLIATVFLLILRPFGLNDYSWPIVLGFGIAVLLSALLNMMLWYGLISKMIDPVRWTVSKEIGKSIFYLAVNIIAIILYADLYTTIDVDGAQILTFSSITLLIAVIPISFRVIQMENRLLKQQLQAATRITKAVKGRETPPHGSREVAIQLKSDQVNESISLSPTQLLFIKAEKNYVEISYLEDSDLKTALIRLSLKKALQQLNQPMIVQCHRSYLVNLRSVKNVTGNAQGLKLHFGDHLPSIPVSRSFTKKVSDLLEEN